MSKRRRLASRLMREIETLNRPMVRRVVRAAFLGTAAAVGVMLLSAITGLLEWWVVLLGAIVGAMLGSLVGRALRPIGERFFGISTNAHLLELANPSYPLLRDLIVRAPGTYTHSVVTAYLAESGAHVVGANALLARVGAYYHDVGKLMRPEFFFENLCGAQNPHDRSAPTRSAEIIRQHVADGVYLAEDYRLPSEVVAIISQHHGTSLVRYFYRKATEADAEVFEADFRYQGKHPQTKEAALVMLADSAEAAVRALRTPTDDQVESTVRRVIGERLSDGQLDHSTLTTDDIDRLAEAFSRMLISMYHPRLEYPGDNQRSELADLRHQPSRA